MTRNTSIALMLCVFLIAGGMTGCAGDPSGSGATVVTEEGNAAANGGDTGAEDKPGTRSNPLAVGTTAVIGDWKVTVTGVDTNADDAVAKANQFNDPPAEGNRYVLVSVDATYDGEESGTFWVDVTSKFYGGGGNTFDGALAAVKNPISDAGETFPGASISGDMVFEVPADQIDDGAVILEAFTFGDTARTFWAVK